MSWGWSAVLVLLCQSLLGCEGSAAPSLPGVPCYRTVECGRGLVCLEGVCSSTLTSAVPEPMAIAVPELDEGANSEQPERPERPQPPLDAGREQTERPQPPLDAGRGQTGPTTDAQ